MQCDKAGFILNFWLRPLTDEMTQCQTFKQPVLR
jgi:hypothetical protein